MPIAQREDPLRATGKRWLARRLNLPSVTLLVLVALARIQPAGSAAAEAGPAGHWEGAVTLPATLLGIRVDLERDPSGAWKGTIDIPVQALRGFALGGVKVNGSDVAFAMPGIPGDPRFAGKLDGAAKTISGDFTQGGQTFPFKLERRARAASTSGETPGKGVPGKGLLGVWQGSLKPNPVIELRLVLEITNAPGSKLEAAVVSVDQGSARIPAAALTEKAGAVHFETPSVSGAFDGRLSEDGSEIAGTWKQGGQELPLAFKRLAQAPVLARPQEPKKPYPYVEEEVTVGHDGLKLAGTFTHPRDAAPHPAVVLLTGSGAQDRDEAIMGHRPFLVLADHLTREGIAVLRCDDRGTAQSTGDFARATDDDFVADTLASVTWLRARPEVDAQRIGLIGHSEGGIVAPLAAVKSTNVAFIVLLAGVGVPMEELLVRQGQDLARVMGASPEMIATNTAAQRQIFRVIREEKEPSAAEARLRQVMRELTANLTDEQRQAVGLSDAMLEAQIKTVLTPWFRQLLAYDPRPTLRKVKCPVLALNGEKDLQVAARENLPAIREALAAGGNTRVKTVELPGLNHLFQASTTGAVAEYGQIEETFNPAALKVISDWIREVTAR